jgi:TldD protein
MSEMIKIQTVEPIPYDPADLYFLQDLAKAEGITFFNARLVQGNVSSFSLLNKVSKFSNTGISHGFSITAFCEGGWGLASGQDFTKENLRATFIEAIRLAKWSARLAKEKYLIAERDGDYESYCTKQKIPLGNISPDQRIQTLLDIEKECYLDPRIVSTRVSYMDSESEKVIYNSFNQFVRIKNASMFFSLQAVAKDGNNQQGYHVSDGGSGGFEHLKGCIGKGTEAAKNALELLDAKPAKPGKFDIIMDPLLTGTFIHEAMGHALEADGILAGESILIDKEGQKIGNDAITIIDDATLQSGFGYIPFDDEGIPGQKKVLVENGVLKGYMHTLETASKMNVEPTGNARAGGFSKPPIVRMTNTFLEPGDFALEELMKELKNGILGVGWKYGYTDPATGALMFKMAKAYQVENGEKTQILRDAAISGMTLDVLQRISHLSKDLMYDPGHCGKGGQSVNVGSGGPYVLIKDMVIGGQ